MLVVIFADGMNLTSLIVHALATSRALETGRTTDPVLVRLTDDIFRISGADECAFGACGAGVRALVYDLDHLVSIGAPEQHGPGYDVFYGGGRAFVLLFNGSLPFVKTVVAACARAELPTILALRGDVAFCHLAKADLHVPFASVGDLADHYRRTVAYNACLLDQPNTSKCLIKVFHLNERALSAAARAAQTVQQMLVRRLEFLTSDIVDVRDQAIRYLESAAVGGGSGSAHTP